MESVRDLSSVRRGVEPHVDERRRRVLLRGRQSCSSSASVAGLRVSRKYRRSRRPDVRRLQQRQYDKLRRIVPSLRRLDTAANQRRVTKVTIVEETIRYIDQLHQMLAKRVQADDDTHRELVVDAAKTAFIRRHQHAATAATDGGDTSLGNGRHVRISTASSKHGLTDSSDVPLTDSSA